MRLCSAENEHMRARTSVGAFFFANETIRKGRKRRFARLVEAVASRKKKRADGKKNNKKGFLFVVVGEGSFRR